MERSMIIVGGRLRAGRSTLAKNIADGLHAERDTRYISFGDTVRAIGHQAMIHGNFGDDYLDSFYTDTIKNHLQSHNAADPLDDEIAWGVMHETLTRTDDAELLIIDGYPKNKTQADDLVNLARGDDRRIAGLLIASVNEREALTRMLKRGQNNDILSYDENTALDQLYRHDQAFGAAVLHLASMNIPIERVDTTGPKSDSAKEGLKYAKSFLDIQT